ncbi:hypothetical protein PR048_018951 [Dryococelus australis]|uniref:Uncharacterized protein n=1 Tax=Dryococelus australis TaxID=614101 RepID=A0ABQ9H266_9NEOP|nr:hypothetical protein PR048_018951 [Dryococelus australis]
MAGPHQQLPSGFVRVRRRCVGFCVAIGAGPGVCDSLDVSPVSLPRLLDLGRGVPTGFDPILKRCNMLVLHDILRKQPNMYIGAGGCMWHWRSGSGGGRRRGGRVAAIFTRGCRRRDAQAPPLPSVCGRVTRSQTLVAGHGGCAVSLLAAPPPRRTGFNPRPGNTRIFASGDRAALCHWSPGLLGDLPVFPRPFHSGVAPYSPHFILIGSQDLALALRLIESGVQVAWGGEIGEGIGRGFCWGPVPVFIAAFAWSDFRETVENRHKDGRTGNRNRVLPNASPKCPAERLDPGAITDPPPPLYSISSYIRSLAGGVISFPTRAVTSPVSLLIEDRLKIACEIDALEQWWSNFNKGRWMPRCKGAIRVALPCVSSAQSPLRATTMQCRVCLSFYWPEIYSNVQFLSYRSFGRVRASSPSALTRNRLHSLGFTPSRPFTARTPRPQSCRTPLRARTQLDGIRQNCWPLDRGCTYSVVGCHPGFAQDFLKLSRSTERPMSRILLRLLLVSASSARGGGL